MSDVMKYCNSNLPTVLVAKVTMFSHDFYTCSMVLAGSMVLACVTVIS